LTALGVLRMLPVLQRLGNAYGFLLIYTSDRHIHIYIHKDTLIANRNTLQLYWRRSNKLFVLEFETDEAIHFKLLIQIDGSV